MKYLLTLLITIAAFSCSTPSTKAPDTIVVVNVNAPQVIRPKSNLEVGIDGAGRLMRSKKINGTAKGAIVGGAVGVVAGAAIGKKDRVKGAAIGGLVGAGVGALVGNSIDKKKKKQQAY